MLIPMDRPIIDARNIREAATQTISGNDVGDPAIIHNNRRTVRISLTGSSDTWTQGSTVQAIQSGVRVGQRLRILVVDDGSTNKLKIINGTGTAKTVLRGDWQTNRFESLTVYNTYLELEWNGTYWMEVERYDGNGWTASGVSAHAEGESTTASGSVSHAEGGSTIASATYSHAEGRNCEATQVYTHASGYRAKAHLHGQNAHSGGQFTATGDAQNSRAVLRGSTADATLTEIFLDGDDDRLTVLDEYAYACEVTVVGRQDTGVDHFMGTYRALIKRTGGAVGLVGVVDVVYENNAGGWGAGGGLPVEITAANNALTIKVEGLAAHNIRWVATVYWTQVKYAN